MTDRYLQFFQQDVDKIPENMIEFCCVSVRIDRLQLNSDEPLHLEVRQNQSEDIWYNKKANYDRFGDLDIVQKQKFEGKPYKCLAHFYTHFDYLKGFHDLLVDEKNTNYYRMRTHSTNTDTGKVNMDITLYVDRMYLLNMYEREMVPELICKILTNPKHVKDRELTEEFCDANLIKSNLAVIPKLKAEYKRTPFKYQSENIQWMVDQEVKADKGYLNCKGFINNTDQTVYHINSIEDDLVYNSHSGRMMDPAQAKSVSIEIKGGVLADDIGLGKTMSMLGLVMERKTAWLKRRATNPNKSLIKIKRTPSLVICPGRLCKQWEEEIGKTGQLRHAVLATIAQYKRLLRQNLRNLDVVIMSYNFLTNSNYQKYIEDTNNDDRIVITEYPWERIILDEGHEYIRGNRRKYRSQFRQESVPIRDELIKMKSKYRWICSGTPFSNKDDCWYLINYLTMGQLDITHQKEYERLYQQVLKTMFRKNTKESVTQQIQIPKPDITTDFLELTTIERSIYNSALGNREKMIQFCNHIMVSDDFANILGSTPLPLEEIHEKMTAYYGKKDSSYTKQLAKLEESLNTVNKQIEDLEKGKTVKRGAEVLTVDRLQQEQHEIVMKTSEIENDYRLNHAKFKIFESLSDKIEESGDCPICYSSFDDDSTSPVITPCGHIFCLECMEGLYANKGANEQPCPVCRYKVMKGDINVVKKGSQLEETVKDINKWGTKMANLIKYLREVLNNKDNRVIVFSQWDSMLKLISKTFNECDINHIFINGSVHVVAGRIRRFKLDTSIRVCLLSSDKAPSGLNLTEANHIVLLDTLDTDRESARVIEEQAIGRSVRIGQKGQVKVKRFIMMNTIEHDFYLNNIGADVENPLDAESENEEEEEVNLEDEIIDDDKVEEEKEEEKDEKEVNLEEAIIDQKEDEIDDELQEDKNNKDKKEKVQDDLSVDLEDSDEEIIDDRDEEIIDDRDEEIIDDQDEEIIDDRDEEIISDEEERPIARRVKV